ncbi:MAG: 4a-hydroxytetrahydrobiopterin dehydratase [Gemmatimonadota bacterium]
MAQTEKPHDRGEIGEKLKALPGWVFDNNALQRTYKSNGWGSTLMVVNAIGFLCEAAGHHPDLSVSWSSVVVRLWTHTANGVTDKDFEVARMIEEAVLWRPTATSTLKGPPREIVRGEG